MAPSGALLRAFGEFNREEWFDCHETLEDLWIGSEGDPRWLYQGLLQVAVALHHWRNGNYGGALSLLEGGSGYLRRLPDACQRIDVADLLERVARCREALVQLGQERMAELDPALIPRLRLAPPPEEW